MLPSSATAPDVVPVMTGASSDPVTVTVTVSLTDSPSAVVDITGKVSLNRLTAAKALYRGVVEVVSPGTTAGYRERSVGA